MRVNEVIKDKRNDYTLLFLKGLQYITNDVSTQSNHSFSFQNSTSRFVYPPNNLLFPWYRHSHFLFYRDKQRAVGITAVN